MARVITIIFFRMSIGSMSPVDFKKRLCRPVEFQGQGPSWRRGGAGDGDGARTSFSNRRATDEKRGKERTPGGRTLCTERANYKSLL